MLHYAAKQEREGFLNWPEQVERAELPVPARVRGGDDGRLHQVQVLQQHVFGGGGERSLRRTLMSWEITAAAGEDNGDREPGADPEGEGGAGGGGHRRHGQVHGGKLTKFHSK